MMALFEQFGYMAHGVCLLWQPWLIALHAGSDVLIFAAYMALPLGILQFRRLRPDLDAGHLMMLFAAFILLCGLSHLIGMVTLWMPIYEIQGAVKLMTAAVSVATAVVLIPMVPQLAALPSPSQLNAANASLKREVEAHESTMSRLREARDALEEKVAQRTEELEAANARLTVLTRETAHRSKNMLAVVQSIASQTGRSTTDTKAFLDRFSDRLAALAAAAETVSVHQEKWAGDLRAVIRSQTNAYQEAYPDRITIDGPELPVSAEAAQLLGLAVHELATNAVKYGALGGPGGRIAIHWALSNEYGTETLTLDWRETLPEVAGPVSARSGTGVGQKLLLGAVPAQLGGTATQDFEEGALHWRLSVPLASVSPQHH